MAGETLCHGWRTVVALKPRAVGAHEPNDDTLPAVSSHTAARPCPHCHNASFGLNAVLPSFSGWRPVDTVSAHNCTLHNPAMFTFNLFMVCCSLTNVMSLSLSLFFPPHAPFVFVSCFYHFPLACSLFCHHFIKTNNEMICFNAHRVGCFGFVFVF